MTQGSFFPPVPSAYRSIDDVDATAEVGPAWYRPSESELPGALAWVVVIGSSPTTAVSLENWRVGSNGVVVTLAVRAAERGRRDRKALWQALGVHHGRGELAMLLPPGGLRFGFGFADGRRVTNLDEGGWASLPDGVGPADHVPDHPCLEGLGRSTTGAATWQRDVWLWPLPPAGTLTAVCSWPDRGIGETVTELPADELLAAAAQVRSAFDTSR